MLLSKHINMIPVLSSVEEYDRYGFSHRHYMEETPVEEEDPLINKAAVFERQSEELNTKVKVRVYFYHSSLDLFTT